jgi:hypothetical protein
MRTVPAAPSGEIPLGLIHEVLGVPLSSTRCGALTTVGRVLDEKSDAMPNPTNPPPTTSEWI